jgi:hypothetical protein
MYKLIDIWKRLDGKTLVRYRCFEILASNRFCVQSSDHYRLPLDEPQLAQSDRQFLELLIEEAPEARAKGFLHGTSLLKNLSFVTASHLSVNSET